MCKRPLLSRLDRADSIRGHAASRMNNRAVVRRNAGGWPRAKHRDEVKRTRFWETNHQRSYARAHGLSHRVPAVDVISYES